MAGWPSLAAWIVTSVAVPVGIGLGSAFIGYTLSIKKTRVEARIAARRATYEQLLPALADLVASDALEVTLAIHEYPSEAHEDRARAKRDEAFAKRTAAIETIDSVVLRGQLAASSPVLDALRDLRSNLDDTRAAFMSESVDYVDALEADLSASRRALAAIQAAIDDEA
jgi:hypothetical protein